MERIGLRKLPQPGTAGLLSCWVHKLEGGGGWGVESVLLRCGHVVTTHTLHRSERLCSAVRGSTYRVARPGPP